MKKAALLAAIAGAAIAAQAQYTAEVPYLQPIADSDASIFDVIILNEDCQNRLTAAGKTVNNIGPDDVTRHLYVWDGTFVAGDASYPGVGWDAENMNFDGYTSLTVGTVGWSGAGFAVAAPGVDLSHMNENTHFHMAYRTESNAPASTALILLDMDGVNKPGKIALGEAFNDNGAVFPTVAPKPGEDWVAVDITFAQIKRLFPAFDYEANAKAGLNGNVMSFLCGGVTGTNLSMDAVYFYTPASSGVDKVTVDSDLLYTGRTINAAGADSIVLFDMSGKTVKSVNGSVMGVDGLNPGIYVAKAGSRTAKIVVR